MSNHLVSGINLDQFKTKILEINFLNKGLDGSKKASLSYEPSGTQGHIWLVDISRNRNCKGQWFLNKEKQYSWKIKCFDGLEASGTLNDLMNQTGLGKGTDSFNNKVIFTFHPKKN